MEEDVPILGKGPANKSDEFLEKFQAAFDPPPSFSENHVANFFRKTSEKNLFKGPKSAT